MDNVGYNLNDAISDLLKRSGVETPFYKKKWFIGVMIGSAVLIIGVTVLLALLLINNDDDNSSTDNNNNNKEVLGEIKCVFQINDTSRITNILGEEFEKGELDFDIMVNDNKIEYAKSYKFPEVGNNDVIFKIYSLEISMKNMFKNVKALISIELNSYINI